MGIVRNFCQMPSQVKVLKSCVAHVLIRSSISWHIEDLHERFSMCNTNPENNLNSFRHPGHMNGQSVLSGEFKGSLDPLALLRDKSDFIKESKSLRVFWSLPSSICAAAIALSTRLFPSTLGLWCLDLLCFRWEQLYTRVTFSMMIAMIRPINLRFVNRITFEMLAGKVHSCRQVECGKSAYSDHSRHRW